MTLQRPTTARGPAPERHRTSAPARAKAPAPPPAHAVQRLQQRLGNQRLHALLTPLQPGAAPRLGTAPGARMTTVPAPAMRPGTVAAKEQALPPRGMAVGDKNARAAGGGKPSQAAAAKDRAQAEQAKGAGAAPAMAAVAPGGPAVKAASAAAAAAAGQGASPVARAAAGAAVGSEAAAQVVAPLPQEALAPTLAAVGQRASAARIHAAASDVVASAQAAGLQPATEQVRGAAVQTVGGLSAAQAAAVRKQQFKDRLRKAIQDATPQPKTQDEAEKVVKGGGAQASATLRGELAGEREAAAGPMKAAAAQETPAGSQPAPLQAPLQIAPAGPAPAPVAAGPVAPAPLPPQRLDYAADRVPADQALAQAGMRAEQLHQGHEPAFTAALQARNAAQQHEARAEGHYRAQEAQEQAQAQASAQGALARGLGSVHAGRVAQFVQVGGRQQGTAARDAAERQRVTDKITRIKDETKAEVASILNGMEAEASALFDGGLKAAEAAYDSTFEDAKGGVATWLTTWGEDWDRHIAEALAKARSAYMKQVDTAIDQVADFIDDKIEAARARVAAGRKAVEDEVAGLDAGLREAGERARDAVSADFDTLGASIDERRDALVDKLVQQYKASYERMSAQEEALRAENRSLWQRASDATLGLVQQVLAFKEMLLGVLGRAAAVVGDILADPIGFLGNLVAGVLAGLKNFVANLGTHLKKGLMDWLFGALAGAGLTLPETLDLKGIVSIVLQVLGLTYANFRKRAAAIVGEPVVAAMEQAAEVFRIVMTQGIGGLWEFIKEKVADLKSMVLDAIFDFIKEKVIVAGITWIIGLLNPASAFFKACKAIYDIVQFFVNRGAQILSLVNAVIDSLASIVKGNLSVAANFVEGALAKAVPVAIGFLAGLLGLGDPSKPVRNTIDKAQSPVNKAMDWVIHQAVKVVKAAGKFFKGLIGGKEKVPGTGAVDGPQEVRTLVQTALQERLGLEVDEAEAEKVVRQVEQDFKPQGVKSVRLGNEDKNGVRPIFVEASPLEKVMNLIARKVIVAISAEVKVGKGPVLDGILHGPSGSGPAGHLQETMNFLRPSLTSQQRIAALPAVSQPPKTPAKLGEQPSGGVIFDPKEGSSSLEIVAWNTGVSIGKKDAEGNYGSNVSHAEHQFVDWFLRRPLPWRQRVVSVEITIESSRKNVDRICSLCLADLDKIDKLHPGILRPPIFIPAGKAAPNEEKLQVKK